MLKQTCSRERQPILALARLRDGPLKSLIVQLFNRAVRRGEVASAGTVNARSPRRRIVCRQYHEALLEWQVIGDVAVARKQHVRKRFISVHSDKIADVAIG